MSFAAGNAPIRPCPVCRGTGAVYKVPNVHRFFPALAGDIPTLASQIPPMRRLCLCRRCKWKGYVVEDRTSER